jgi:hypothetical protein
MARSRAGAHPKRGWRSQCALACADQWHIGWGKQELLVENGQDHEQDDKIPRSRRVEDLGSGAYDYNEMRPTSKAPWRTSSSTGRCCSSSFGRRPRLVHRGVRDQEEGHQDPRWYRRRRGKTGATISSRSGQRRPAPGEGHRRRPLGLGGGAWNRWAEENGWPAPVCSTERRRWIGQKGDRGRER